MLKRRNRKRQKVNSRALPIRLASFLIVVAIISICHIQFGTMCSTLSDQIKKLENENNDHLFKLRREQSQWTQLTTAEHIDEALVKHGLNMTLPRGEYVVRLHVDRLESDYRSGARLASHR